MSKVIIEKLKVTEKEFNLKIYLNNVDTGKTDSIFDLLKHLDSTTTTDPDENSKSSQQVIQQQLTGLLPSWVKEPKILFNSKNREQMITLEVKNDFTDIERLQFLEILLENQVGQPIKIKQSYDYQPQVDLTKNIINKYIKDYVLDVQEENRKVNLEYSSFPLDRRIEEELKKEIKNNAKFTLEIANTYDPQPVSLSLKKDIIESTPEIEFAYVYFDQDQKKFIILIPFENINVNEREELIKDLRKKNSFELEIRSIEENPSIYFKERLLTSLISQKKIKKLKFSDDNKTIDIYCTNPLVNISQSIWRKILFRFTKFMVNFIDQKNKIYHLADFSYYQGLDTSELVDIILKLLPNELDIKNVVWLEIANSFQIKYNNLLYSSEFLNKLKNTFQTVWKIAVGFSSYRGQEELANTLKNELQEWIIQPKVSVDDRTINLTVENDYTDENRLQEFCNNFSKNHLIPISLQFNLSVSRIKYVVINTLREYLEITRLKVYPNKNQIYLEGILKRYIDDDIIQEALDSIETRTKYVIEPYIKSNKAVKGETVHDILTKLNESYELTNEFPEDVMNEVRTIPDINFEQEIKSRLDLREWDCTSIDTPGTKLIDDLVSIQRLVHDDKEDEFLLGIHIADVDYFIPKNLHLEDEIRKRGQSMYLGEYYPMLPEELSEKISLDEKKDRLAVSMLIEISLDGEIVDYWLKKTIVRNKKQYDFDQVNEILLEQQGDYFDDLQLLVNLTHLLKHQRIERGSFNLDIDFVPDNQASQIISEIMILANRLMGFYMQSLSGQKIFRNQHIPSYAYVSLAQTLELYGYKLDLLNKNPLIELNQILSQAAQKNEHELIFRELHRYLSNSYYSHNCYGYESLGTHFYTHWTSPLRRYIDIVVVRLALSNESVYIDNLVGICQYQSAIERFSKTRADNYYIQQNLKRISQIKDKPLLAELYGLNRKQVVFIIKELNAYATIRLSNNPSLMLLEAEEGVEYLGELIELGKPVFFQIYEIYQEKRDINLLLGLLEHENVEHNNLLKARITFLR
ncbi:MAG: ribonuclease catalytic domain-containing protein [Candidatus Thorarchaeota archaeon]